MVQVRPEHQVRTGMFCPYCGSHIYAAESVHRVGTIQGAAAFAHVDCTPGPITAEVITLPPTQEWLGWTDYPRWRREYADAIDAELDGGTDT